MKNQTTPERDAMKLTTMTVKGHKYFAKSIGYVRDKGATGFTGPRKQKRWVLGKSEAEAILQAAKIKAQWQRVVKGHAAYLAQLRTTQIEIEAEDLLPRWTEVDLANLEGQDYQSELEKKGRHSSWAPTAEDGQANVITTSRAVESWLAHKTKGLALRNLASIKQSTVNRYTSNIDACLRQFPQYAVLSMFDSSALLTIHDYWMGKDHSGRICKGQGKEKVKMVSERLAINYLRDLKAFLTYCGSVEDFGFTPPKELAQWKFKLKKSKPITPTMAELKSIMQNAPPRLRAYVLLALNAGQAAVDIGVLKPNHIVPGGEAMMLHKQRVKTEETNDFKGSWELWPETLKAIDAVKATSAVTNNPKGLLFLNSIGKPVHYVVPGFTSNSVGEDFRRIVKPLIDKGDVRNGVDFKSLRAWGGSWIANEAKTEYLAKIYLAHAVASSATQAYVNAQYDLITPWLHKMREALKTGEVI